MSVVHVKDGVRFDRITPAGVHLLAAIDAAAIGVGLDLTITCGTERHPPDDPHTLGQAYDLRVDGLSVDQILDVRHALQALLGSGFTVLYETPYEPASSRLAVVAFVNHQATADHIHVQLKNGATYPPAPPVLATVTG